jgi:hypothetical protein
LSQAFADLASNISNEHHDTHTESNSDDAGLSAEDIDGKPFLDSDGEEMPGLEECSDSE